MDKILMLFLILLLPASAEGSHSLSAFLTYHKGKTPFPDFSIVSMLDDITIIYYNGDTDTMIYRGNTTNEDALINPLEVMKILDDSIYGRWKVVMGHLNNTPGVPTYQRLVLCELMDNGDPGEMLTSDAFQGSTLDELHWYNGTMKYTSQLNTDFDYNLATTLFENIYYPLCIKTLKGYLENRENQVNRKVKPRVHIIIKNPWGSRVMCLATGFYPRHINLTLFRDGQPVSNDEITGGDLLPNDDGTYQMRKILNISEKEQREKHKYTCTATHLSLDNKLDVTLEYDGTALKPVLSSVLTAVVLMIGIVVAVILCKKLQAASEEAVTSTAGSLSNIALRSQSPNDLHMSQSPSQPAHTPV